jgi:hypothetical protein
MRLVTTLGVVLLTSACALPQSQRRATPPGQPGVWVVVPATTARCTVVVLGDETRRLCLPPKRKPKEPQDSTRADTIPRVTVAAR